MNLFENFVEDTQQKSFCLTELLQKSEKLHHVAKKSLYNNLIKVFDDLSELTTIGVNAKENRYYDICYEVSKKLLRTSKFQHEMHVANNNHRFSCLHTLEATEALPLSIQSYNKSKDLADLLDVGLSYSALNRYDLACKIYFYVLNQKSVDPEVITKVNFNLSRYYFYQGNLNEGLTRYLKLGSKLNYWSLDDIPFDVDKCKSFKRWEGEEVNDKPILCVGSAGIGDEIINIRFVLELQNKFKNIFYISRSFDPENRNDLLDVFENSGINVIKTEEELENLGEFYWVYSQHLPLIMKKNKDNVLYENYIIPNNRYVQKWKEKISKNKRLKIGIRWKGNLQFEQDLGRTVDLKNLYEKLKHIDADFYSLHNKNSQENIHEFPGLINLEDELECWDDTLGLLQNLDFIITSCTSVAHIAAASGVKVFVLSPILEYYVWCIDSTELNRTKTYWYGDNVKVFRQKQNKSWKEPIDDLIDYIEYYET